MGVAQCATVQSTTVVPQYAAALVDITPGVIVQLLHCTLQLV